MKVLAAYGSLFRIRFNSGIQYRAAALGGIATQFAWGFLNILLYMTFFRENPDAFPMSLTSVVSYMWLRQAFLMLFETWRTEPQIMSAIQDGGVAYELARPWGSTVRGIRASFPRAFPPCFCGHGRCCWWRSACPRPGE